MTSCKQFETYISEFVDSELPPAMRKVMAEHMSSCDYCAYLYKSITKVSEALHRLGRVQTSSTFESRLRERIIQEAASGAEKGAWINPKAFINGKTLAGAGAMLLLFGGLTVILQRGDHSDLNSFQSLDTPETAVRNATSTGGGYSLPVLKSGSGTNIGGGTAIQKSDTTDEKYLSGENRYNKKVKYVNE